MNRILKKGVCFISIIFLISCGTNKITTENKDVNTQPNSKYKKSRKAYSGKLNNSEYGEIIKKIEMELKTTIPNNKSILVNFNQKAPNCLSVRLSEKDNIQVAKNRIRISSQISSNNNTIDFFVYTKDSYNKEIYEKMPEFILDSGFFYENVFTEHQNCEAILIIKPNGDFHKYYGEDYYTEVDFFLEKN
ncbi:hypothetical protein [Hanstruepera ponticola]|uniref:hypothetical protein n=1 Tax=Hanstruepera ponticola TaxID=2042995 RepID=UPI001786F9F5|nr:hypothetical protein [Hanstruepera ponticola]